MEEMGRRIHNERIKANMTMEELGSKCGVKASAVNKWEKGIVTNIPINMLINISNALGVDVSLLIGNESTAEKSINIIEKHMQNLDISALDRVIKYAEYLKTISHVPTDKEIMDALKNTEGKL